MAECTYYRIRPLSPLHFGERGVGLEETADTPHSDTLFSAVVWAWRMSDGAVCAEERLRAILAQTHSEGMPPFILSSAFPYADNVLFLPRPLVPLKGRSGPSQEHQAWKRIRYVSWDRMHQIIHQGGTIPPIREDNLLQGGNLWVTPGELGRLRARFGDDMSEFYVWKSGQNALAARVTVDRISSTASLFFFGRVYFRDGCGLCVLVRYGSAEYRPLVERALRFLGETGIGGQRNQGHGQFALEQPPDGDGLLWTGNLPAPAVPNAALLLSLYHPTLREVQTGALRDAQYDLLLRDGWIGSPDNSSERRLGLRMLAEGAVLPHQPVVGDILDVRPAGFSHPVYRSGLALTVPFARKA
jgi:CRISPR-associated protein Csm4